MGLVIAVNKGRIFEECMPLLAACEIQPSDDPKSSRKLIFESLTGNHKIIVARSADVPTYVENGVADVGITGKDTILEYGAEMTFYERLDLKIGACRMMTAGPVGVAEPAQGVRVASKFVNIARQYYQKQSKQVSLIKLSGALEIAPLLGLADCIVDIVDTGNTLKANGLEARETICEISTRLIVNRASMKTKFDLVQGLIQQLEAAVEQHVPDVGQ
ncbi:MAG: ATP phosphoribosyltransferase [Gammaproteobacteria bacterium]|jgi:ATP phosphoribosyltransferase|nr:ATP phosphoribosyltransferase [Gammaproteobacteria bacterium]HBX00992.1 ATP phosphoribosyltransferase [Gammaproteobacteria bacterium]|tara:strand:- start:3047 stop:3697 length:651 start_codon:yes stop_codon:yes gene_type:complete